MRLKNITVLFAVFFFICNSILPSSQTIRKNNVESEKDSTKSRNMQAESARKHKVFSVNKTEKEWKETLTEEQFYVLRTKGTERAFSGKYYSTGEAGIYYCAACGNELFSSEEKYDSGSGWPSFYAPRSKKDIEEITDVSLGMERTEIVCSRCGGHLGHVFPDGPMPTGLRYCVNSVSLKFVKSKKK